MYTEEQWKNEAEAEDTAGRDAVDFSMKKLINLGHKYLQIGDLVKREDLPLTPEIIQERMDVDTPVFLIVRDFVESGMMNDMVYQESQKGEDLSHIMKMHLRG